MSEKKRAELRDITSNMEVGDTKLSIGTARGAGGSRPITPEPTDLLYERNLIRVLAQVHFINAEVCSNSYLLLLLFNMMFCLSISIILYIIFTILKCVFFSH